MLCGHTASQDAHPMQALGRLSSGKEFTYIGAIKPPPVKESSLYRAISFGISRPWGQYSVQYRQDVQGTFLVKCRAISKSLPNSSSFNGSFVS